MQLSPHMRTESDAPGRVSKKPRVGVNRAYGKGRRYYSPTLGRWLSRDPVAEVGFQYAFAQVASLVDRPLSDMSISYTRLDVRPVFGVIDQSGGLSRLYLFVANDGISSWDYLGLYQRVVPAAVTEASSSLYVHGDLALGNIHHPLPTIPLGDSLLLDLQAGSAIFRTPASSTSRPPCSGSAHPTDHASSQEA